VRVEGGVRGVWGVRDGARRSSRGYVLLADKHRGVGMVGGGVCVTTESRLQEKTQGNKGKRSHTRHALRRALPVGS
jgi:hypothetical protein